MKIERTVTISGSSPSYSTGEAPIELYELRTEDGETVIVRPLRFGLARHQILLEDLEAAIAALRGEGVTQVGAKLEEQVDRYDKDVHDFWGLNEKAEDAEARAEVAETALREAEQELEKAQRAGAALAGDSAGFFRDLAKAAAGPHHGRGVRRYDDEDDGDPS